MRDAVGAEKLARGEVAPATQAAEDSRVAQAFERPLRVAVDSGVSGVGPARGSHIICLPPYEGVGFGCGGQRQKECLGKLTNSFVHAFGRSSGSALRSRERRPEDVPRAKCP